MIIQHEMNSAAAITAIILLGCESLSFLIFQMVTAVTIQKSEDIVPIK
jgi:hypothetical protein